MRTYQGQINIYFHPNYLELDLAYFINTKIFYLPTNTPDELGRSISKQSAGDHLSDLEGKDRKIQKLPVSK